MCVDDVASNICLALTDGRALVSFMCVLYWVGPARCCSPRHPTHPEPSIICICPSYISSPLIKTLQETPHLDPQREPNH